MRCGTIPKDDKLFRHSVYPNGFPAKRFSPAGIIKLFDQADGSLLGSVAWQRFFPTTAHIHAYGCRLAAKQNEKLIANGKFRPERKEGEEKEEKEEKQEKRMAKKMMMKKTRKIAVMLNWQL
jgi:hypothetical protein